MCYEKGKQKLSRISYSVEFLWISISHVIWSISIRQQWLCSSLEKIKKIHHIICVVFSLFIFALVR